MLTAVIIAGGKGTRFWPLSTEQKPKQFLNLIGNETMIQMTVNRIKPIIPLERIFVCTCEMYVDLVREQLPELLERNIIIEPEGRNTAPCIALSAMVINRYYKDATMVVLPSDHLINREDVFRNLVVKCNEALNIMTEGIITFGINPTRPETGYGYIKVSKDNSFCLNGLARVEAFVEKPNIEKAKEYLEEGTYLWNGGMFIWRIKYIIEKIKTYLPNTYKALSVIESEEEDNLQVVINNRYSLTDKTSIDYGILEKDKNIYVMPSKIGWDDVGSWEAIDRYREKDENGNVLVGRSKAVRAENNLIISANNKVIVEGLSDIYVIENDGKILVGHKQNVANIKELERII